MQALVHASSLRPEIRLQQAIADYEKYLNDGERQTFQGFVRNGAPTVTDIVRLTAEIDRDAGRKHKSWRSKGTRLTNLLSSVQKFTAFGDIVVGGSQFLPACGVWAAVRFALHASVCHVQYFEKLSGLIMEIGRTAPVHSELAFLYPQSAVLQSLMSEYMFRVIQICHKVVQFTKKSTLAQVACSALGNFDVEFEPLSKELQTIGAVIDKQVLVLSIQDQNQQNSKSKTFAFLSSEESRRAVRDEKIFRLFKELCPELKALESIRIRERKKGTTTWLFSTAEYQRWKNSDKSAVLFVQGNLGCGKTVLFANIVDDLHLPPESPSAQHVVTSSFCKAEVSGSRGAQAIIGYIALQILRHSKLRLPLERYVDGRSSADMIGMHIVDILKLLRMVLKPNSGPYYVVMDGLEECSDDDVRAVSHFLRGFMSNYRVSVCFSCRDEKLSLPAALPKEVPVYRQTFTRNVNEIGDFINREMEERDASIKLGPKLCSLVQKVLRDGAQGMFLWAALMLDEILPLSGEQPSPPEVLGIIEDLPKTLPEVFDRAICAIKDPANTSQIFKLVAAAARPLHQDELLEAVAVEPGIFTWTPLPKYIKAASLIQKSGGSLITIDEDLCTVHFIHHSVLQHLFATTVTPNQARNSKFKPEEAIKFIRGVCITYLNFGEFCTRVTHHTAALTIGTKSLSSDIVRAALPRDSLSTKLIWGILKTKPTGRKEEQIDIGRLIQNYRDEYLSESQARRAESFLGYARNYWLEHSRTIQDNDYPIFGKWISIVQGGVDSVTLPWTTHDGVLRWAMENSHPALLINYFVHLLISGPLLRVEVLEVMAALIRKEQTSNDYQSSRHGGASTGFYASRQELGDVVALLAMASNFILESRTGSLPESTDDLELILKWYVQKGADPDHPLVGGVRLVQHEYMAGKMPVVIAVWSVHLTAASRLKLLRWLLEAGATPKLDPEALKSIPLGASEENLLVTQGVDGVLGEFTSGQKKYPGLMVLEPNAPKPTIPRSRNGRIPGAIG